jgi:hypothetical protein
VTGKLKFARTYSVCSRLKENKGVAQEGIRQVTNSQGLRRTDDLCG